MKGNIKFYRGYVQKNITKGQVLKEDKYLADFKSF